jgi:hypothetical protein
MSNFPNLTNIPTQENTTLALAQPIVALIQGSSAVSQNQPVALFALDHVANSYVPATSDQVNGSARWVDTSRDLATLGVDPNADQIALNVWVEARRNYYEVGLILKEFKENPAKTIELILA